MERQQIKLSDNSVRSSLPAEPVLLSPRCLLLVVLASSVPFFVLVPLPVRNLRVVNSHLPRPPSVCLPSLLCVYRTGSSTRANRTGRKKQPNRYRRGTRWAEVLLLSYLGRDEHRFSRSRVNHLLGHLSFQNGMTTPIRQSFYFRFTVE